MIRVNSHTYIATSANLKMNCVHTIFTVPVATTYLQKCVATVRQKSCGACGAVRTVLVSPIVFVAYWKLSMSIAPVQYETCSKRSVQKSASKNVVQQNVCSTYVLQQRPNMTTLLELLLPLLLWLFFAVAQNRCLFVPQASWSWRECLRANSGGRQQVPLGRTMSATGLWLSRMQRLFSCLEIF